MTKLNEIYKCNICGNLVEILHTGVGKLVCCGQPMESKEPNTEDASIEKHVPFVERVGGIIEVTVGSALHPMEEKHYIEWIEVISGNKVMRRNLKPGDEPKASFHPKGDKTLVRAYCNLHGLWVKEV